MSAVELVVDCRNTLGEGVTWSPEQRTLFWVDIEKSELWQLDPATGETRTRNMPERACAFALRQNSGLVVAFESGFAFYDLDSGEVERLHEFEPDLPTTRMNDGRCDRQGRFINGGMDESGNGEAISAVYRLDSDRSVHKLISGVACANSICFSPDGRTMYFADTPRGVIRAYDYDTAGGSVSNRRTLCTFDDQPGLPDGSTVDAEGFVWNAQWNGHRVVRYAPNGAVDRVIEVPVMNPTCVAFGGADLETLYVTTARFQMTPEQTAAEPLSGALFAVRPGVGGLPEPKFAG
ncbi:MAG: SMP-30/gluconolactonase/LRE family protein [Alphaproteobacteria bacterium]